MKNTSTKLWRTRLQSYEDQLQQQQGAQSYNIFLRPGGGDVADDKIIITINWLLMNINF